VGPEQLRGLDRGFGGSYTACRLDPSDARDEDPIDEPVPRRHRRPVVEERSVADHDRRAGRVADGNLECAARHSTEQGGERDEVGIGGRHAAKCTKVAVQGPVVGVTEAGRTSGTML